MITLEGVLEGRSSPSGTKRRSFDFADDGNDSEDLGGRTELVYGQNVFRRTSMIYEWRENTMSRACLTIAVLLQPGVEKWKLRALDEGTMLQVRITWPEKM